MTKQNIFINEDGRKYTLTEYFRKVSKEGLFEIKSIKHGHYITGTYEHIKGGLRKEYWGMCIQGIEIDEYGTTLILR